MGCTGHGCETGLCINTQGGRDAVGYARLLREGLAICEGVKDVVGFLIEHIHELRKPAPFGELLALAEQVRMLLAAYPAGDPMVEAIKASEAYQKAACCRRNRSSNRKRIAAISAV